MKGNRRDFVVNYLQKDIEIAKFGLAAEHSYSEKAKQGKVKFFD